MYGPFEPAVFAAQLKAALQLGGYFLHGGGEPLAEGGLAKHYAASLSASARSVVTSTPVQVDHSASARSV